MKFHKWATFVPMMKDKDLRNLADNIAERGQQDPIVLHEDQILDGRNRYTAIQLLIDDGVDVEPKYREFGSREDDGESPVAYVIATLFRNFSITKAQRADAFLRLDKEECNRIAAETKKRRNPTRSGAERPNDGKDTNELIGEQIGVGKTTVREVKAVHKNGSDKLQEALTAGDIGCKKAAAISKHPKDEQDVMLEERKPKKSKPKPTPVPSRPVEHGYRKYDNVKQNTKFQQKLQQAISMGRIEEKEFWKQLRLKGDERQWFYDICWELPWVRWTTSVNFIEVGLIEDSDNISVFELLLDRIESYSQLIDSVGNRFEYCHHDACVFVGDIRRLLASIPNSKR